MLCCFKKHKVSKVDASKALFREAVHTKDIVLFDKWMRELNSVYSHYSLAEACNMICESTTNSTWLHIAVESDFPYAVQELLNNGAQWCYLNKNGKNAIELAEEKKTEGIYDILIDLKGSDVYKVGKSY